MPCRVYSDASVIRHEFSGVVTDREFADLRSASAKLEQAGAVVPHRITDLTGVTRMNIGFSELFDLARSRQQIRFPNSFKSAIVAPQPMHVGFARMYQMLNAHPQITLQIFPDLAAAQKWIAEG